MYQLTLAVLLEKTNETFWPNRIFQTSHNSKSAKSLMFRLTIITSPYGTDRCGICYLRCTCDV